MRRTKKLLLVLVWLYLQTNTWGQGQNLPPSSADTLFTPLTASDTLPAITMKFEPLYLLGYFLVPGVALYVGGHSYEIRDKKFLLASHVKPYFEATQDQDLLNLYQKHRLHRILWYGSTSVAQVVFLVGIVQRVSFFYFVPVYDNRNNNYLYWAGGLTVAGVAARVACFRLLRKAVSLYNFSHAGKVPRVRLQVGASSYVPLGAGLRLKF